MYKRLFFAALCLLVTKAVAQGPGSTAVPFLLIQPSARANAMGGASVATEEPDAISVAFNPAHLGNEAMNSSIRFEFYPSNTKWLPLIADGFGYNARSIQLGYDLKQTGLGLPLNVGAGYTHVSFEVEPQRDRFFAGEESVDIWSIGIGAEYSVKAGIGLSFKQVDSNLGLYKVDVSALDLGFRLQIPISDIINKQFRCPPETRTGWQPFLSAGLGYSQSNIGKEIHYIDADFTDPLPRVARAGINLNGGFSYHSDDWSLRVLSIERIHEAEHLLTRPDGYANFLGDINLWDNVLVAKAERFIAAKRGWEFELCEFFALRLGRYEEPTAKFYSNTDGLGFKLSGLTKLVGSVSPELRHSSVYAFIARHVEVEYNRSEWDVDDDHPFDKTSFKSIRVGLVQR